MDEIQRELREQVRKYCHKHIEPTAEQDDHEMTFRKEVYQGLGELGVTGINLPEEYGGAGLGLTELNMVLEEISKYSVAYAVTLSVSTMVQNIINRFGSQEQKKHYLPDLTSGKEIGAFSLSEASSGSDASSLQCRAKKVGQNYELTGNKMWVSSAGVAKTYVVMARTGEKGSQGVSSFIVEEGTKGFSFGKKEQKMGWRASPTRELIFDKAQVPAKNLLIEEGKGMTVALSGLDGGRITIGAVSCGLAARAISEAVSYSLERKQFGQNIFDFQGLQFLLAEMSCELEAARALTYKTAALYDRKENCSKLAAMTKMKASDMCMRVTTDAVQVFGGVGYTKEYPVERYMRDAKVLQIVEGTNQIQRLVIARHLKKEFS